MPRTDFSSPLIPAGSAASAHCHSLRVRLPEGTDPVLLGGLLDKAARAWWGDVSDQLPHLWVEQVPAAADSPMALHRLRSELSRPVHAAEVSLRAVLLTYEDGVADLVLVAHRSSLDATSLRSIADVLTGRAPHSRFRFVTADRPGGTDAELLKRWEEADYSGRAEWACGDDAAGDRTGTVVVPLPEGATDVMATVAVAAGLVLGRYEGQETPVLATLAGAPERADDALGAFDGGGLLALDLTGALGTAELIAQAGPVLSGHGGHCDDRQYARLVAAVRGRVLAGVLDGGLEAGEGEYLPCQTAPFPLTVVPSRTGDGALQLAVHHLLKDVDEASAEQFARHLAHAYGQVNAADSDASPGDIELLDGAEKRHITALGRPAQVLAWQPDRIDSVFAARAAERPDAIALTCEGKSLTYAELDERAERFAAALRAREVQPGERVGVCLERSLDLVVTMLAVLKADAVYVPMDPTYPADRLAYTAQDAALRIVVTTLEDFPGAEGTRAVRPEALAEHDGELTRDTKGQRAPESAAYIIYTSGSTGRPKGVVVPHRNVVALMSATREDFGLTDDDTWTLFHSSAFDFSVWEIWGPLLTGARLVVVPYWVSRSPEEFHELLVDERVTVLNQTPSAFAQLIEADRHRDERLAVRLVVFGGEPLDARTLRTWFDRYPERQCRLVNMFGITETTVHVTAQTVTRREAMTGSRSVGPALPGWYIYVLDERGRPVPCGVPGEIYVGGEGVALEYLGRPELTEQRFVPDPFAGGRMYRSGDRGRLRPDGRLEHLGRLDTQVKVRGFRIELDEIRNVLLDDPTVTAAAVVLGGDPASDAAGVRIDAYVVLEGGDDTASVRRRAGKVLPEYMVPATVTALSALPLTANGKLNPRKLPAPAAPQAAPIPVMAADPSDSVTAPETEAPAGGLGAALTAVWESVLGVPVGPDDNFFELGGNSLFAVRVAAAMREQGLPPLPMRELYLNPTVSGLAQVLEASQA
ncbi:amino acid adenylation domain-containing protein [Streptomyces sp. NPDC048527]|uniref:non-ribosomal peptide synthetase n=1 Tax=Streptomyces sp. NPDC048527 TaxID=3365568 RepID=UPI003717C8E2